jgi:hypothetical protein
VGSENTKSCRLGFDKECTSQVSQGKTLNLSKHLFLYLYNRYILENDYDDQMRFSRNYLFRFPYITAIIHPLNLLKPSWNI